MNLVFYKKFIIDDWNLKSHKLKELEFGMWYIRIKPKQDNKFIIPHMDFHP